MLPLQGIDNHRTIPPKAMPWAIVPPKAMPWAIELRHFVAFLLLKKIGRNECLKNRATLTAPLRGNK
jgi:hypothetical protein